MRKAVVTAALLLCAGPVLAQDKVAPAPPPAGKGTPPPPRPPPPLSKEDAELVKQLALLEQLDLVRNLELFEGKPDDKPAEASQRQP